MSKHATALRLTICLSFVVCLTALAQEGMLFVTSETDNRGGFSYTITGTNAEFKLGLGTNCVQMQSHCVVDASGPEGWMPSVLDNGIVIWSFTNGTWMVGTNPLVLRVQSRCTNQTDYVDFASDFFRPGALAATVYQNGIYISLFAALRFEYVGPLPVPRIEWLGLAGSETAVAIQEMAGRTCHIDRATSLDSSNWDEVAICPVTNYFGTFTFPAPTNAADSFFYRARFSR